MLEGFSLLSQLPPNDVAVIFGFLGLFLGSFYNVCVDRYLSGESIIYPPSHCETCKASLKSWELIPVISWFLLRGKCSHCGASISFQYPLMELISALVYACVGWQFGFTLSGFSLLVFSALFLILSAIDFKAYLLPDRLTLPGALLAIPASIWGLEHQWVDVLLGALIGAGVFWIIAEIFRRTRGIDGLGLGDVKLMLMLGALVTWEYLSMVVLIAGLCALGAFAVLAMRGSGNDISSVKLPFGPFLCLGAWVALLYGPMIWQAWLAFVLG